LFSNTSYLGYCDPNKYIALSILTFCSFEKSAQYNTFFLVRKILKRLFYFLYYLRFWIRWCFYVSFIIQTFWSILSFLFNILAWFISFLIFILKLFKWFSLNFLSLGKFNFIWFILQRFLFYNIFFLNFIRFARKAIRNFSPDDGFFFILFQIIFAFLITFSFWILSIIYFLLI